MDQDGDRELGTGRGRRGRWPLLVAAVLIVAAAVATPLALASGGTNKPRSASGTTTTTTVTTVTTIGPNSTSTTSGSNTTTTTEPSTTTTSGGTASAVTLLATTPIRAIDWTTVSVPGSVCPGGSGSVTLSGGQGTGVQGDVVQTSGTPTYGRLLSNLHDVAAVAVFCGNSSGSAAAQLQDSLVVFTDTSGSLSVLGTLVATQPAPAAGVHVSVWSDDAGSVTIAPAEIVTHELRYTASDATCCPSGRVTTVWRYGAGAFTPSSTSTASWTVSPSAVNWGAVAYPIGNGCGEGTAAIAVTIAEEQEFQPTGGPTLFAVLAHCTAGAGTPPVALFVYDGATGTTSPDLLATLVTTTQREQAGTFSATSAGVTIDLHGFSSATVPNCCPDVSTTASWTWSGAGLIAS